jgi:iron complex transport system substrate-binding protein
MRQRMRDIDGAANGLPGAPTVVCVEWVEPLMAAGNWVPELVDLAGGDNRLGRAGAHSPRIEWQQVLDEDPDVLLVMPCGFDLLRSCGEAASLAALPGFSDLRAVRADEVYALDGHQFFNRPGPRLVESLEILAEIFRPDRFQFGHEGVGWRRVRRAPP